MAQRRRTVGQRGAERLKAHLVAAVAALAVTGLMLWLMPDRSLPRGPEQAEAPGFGLVYEPPTLFPAYYLPPSLGPRNSELGTPFDAEAAWMPGETVAMNSIVVAAATGRVRELGGQLSEAEMRAVLDQAGWPAELVPAALSVAWCESKWSPWADGDSGRSKGLFQVNLGTWFPYAGEDPAQWADPLTNARVALAVYRYDIARGQAPWTQLSCKPS